MDPVPLVLLCLGQEPEEGLVFEEPSLAASAYTAFPRTSLGPEKR